MSESSRENGVVATLHSSRKRRRKSPRHPAARAARDLAIFKKVEIERFTHEEAARRYGLRRSRVTQIVQRIRRELAEVRGDDAEIENHLAQQRLQRALEKLRLEYALEATAKALHRDPRKLVTSRTGSRDKEGRKEDWNEVITRDKPANLQLVKTFLRVTHDLGRLNEREIAGNPIGQNLTQERLFQAIVSLLDEWRHGDSWRKDPPSDAFFSMVQAFVTNLRSWLLQFRRGASAEDAWPLPVDEQPAGEHRDGINHLAPEINRGLTTCAVNQISATSAVGRS